MKHINLIGIISLSYIFCIFEFKKKIEIKHYEKIIGKNLGKKKTDY